MIFRTKVRAIEKRGNVYDADDAFSGGICRGMFGAFVQPDTDSSARHIT